MHWPCEVNRLNSALAEKDITITRLTQELAAARADADRYRFVKRQYVQTHSPKMDGTVGYRFSHGWPALSGHSFDEAVDFARMVVDEAARAAGGKSRLPCANQNTPGAL